MALPEKLYSAVQVKEFDQIAIEEFKIPGIELMSRAGLAAFEVIRQTWPLAKKFAVICGQGNNGGDGFVLAKLLYNDDFQVEVYSVGKPNAKLSPTAELARTEFLTTGLKIHALPERLEHVDVIVDAVLGTGLRAPLKPEWTQAIALINRTEKPVLAIDLPSGIDGDSGAIVEAAVHANVTICYIGLKYALLTGPALNYAGEVVFNDLGVPQEIFQRRPYQGLIIDLTQALRPLKPRPKASHKGNFGHVLIIGAGKPGYSGAVCLAGLASLHGGAGLTSGLVHPESLPLMTRAPIEMMCHASVESESELWNKATTIVIGPGLTQNEWAQKQFKQACSLKKPMVVDADALHLLAKTPIKNDNWVLTPHPGEAATLLGLSTQAIESDRVDAAMNIQEKYGGVVVLKGAGTIVAAKDKPFYLCTQGNPGMSTGGMGDVLSGLIASLIAQGLSLLDAAKLGVVIHAQAADLELSMGERGMLASELMLHIRSLINPSYHHEQPQANVTELFNF